MFRSVYLFSKIIGAVGRQTHFDIVLSFFTSERTTVPQEINEADRDTSIDVENELRIV
jgi:hypothetical protein